MSGAEASRDQGYMPSAELRDAALAEIMGDVAALHQSVRDLAAIEADIDTRITARVVELRALCTDLAAARETVFGQITAHATKQAQKSFREAMGELLGKVERTLQGVDRGLTAHAGRQFVDRMAVAIMTATFTAIAVLCGVWVMLRFH